MRPARLPLAKIWLQTPPLTEAIREAAPVYVLVAAELAPVPDEDGPAVEVASVDPDPLDPGVAVGVVVPSNGTVVLASTDTPPFSEAGRWLKVWPLISVAVPAGGNVMVEPPSIMTPCPLGRVLYA